jgi:hypothetical protein
MEGGEDWKILSGFFQIKDDNLSNHLLSTTIIWAKLQ